jgi:hypothetical protein
MVSSSSGGDGHLPVNASLSLLQALDDNHLGRQIDAFGSQRQCFRYSASGIAQDTAEGPDLTRRFNRSSQERLPLLPCEVKPFTLFIDDLHLCDNNRQFCNILKGNIGIKGLFTLEINTGCYTNVNSVTVTPNFLQQIVSDKLREAAPCHPGSPFEFDEATRQMNQENHTLPLWPSQNLR